MNINFTSPGTMFPTADVQKADSPKDTIPSTKNPENMFLQLLTTQLKNQSPLDPMDPSQFTTQLAQFNMLDQLAQINQTLKNAFAKR